MTQLPIHAKQSEIVSTVREHQVTIVVGETGSGKTTVLPAMLLEAGFCQQGMIGVTEPRRIAAVSVATHVANHHFGMEVGELVGYHIRHENRTDETTLIKYMTEGILLREMLADRLLAKYEVIVLDETHERNLNQDLLMALILELLPERPDLKVVVMSATINERRFAEYFGAPVVHIEGRTFPVTVEYRGGSSPEMRTQAAIECVREQVGMTPGDILVFVPDYAAIGDMTEAFAELPLPGEIDVLTLYGNQSSEEQMAVFGRTRRAVIIATNVAETSVTLEGVTAVVDTGLIKEMSYFPETGTSALRPVPHSRAGCDQRAGRAGRVAPGTCVRLYSQEDCESRRQFTVPEIMRTNLDHAFLRMRAMGFSEEQVRGFQFMDRPAPAFWDDAVATLLALGALDEDGNVTDDGRRMAEMPLSPSLTKMVLTAERYGCVQVIATIAAIMNARPIFLRPPGREEEAEAVQRCFRNPKSDFLTALKAVRSWRKATDRAAFAELHLLHQRTLEEIDLAEEQILAILNEHGIEPSDGTDAEDVGRSIATGLMMNLLTSDGSSFYKSKRCTGVRIFPGSSLRDGDPPKFAVASELVATKRLYARNVHAVPARWLEEVFGIETHKHRRKTGSKAGGKTAATETQR